MSDFKLSKEAGFLEFEGYKESEEELLLAECESGVSPEEMVTLDDTIMREDETGTIIN